MSSHSSELPEARVTSTVPNLPPITRDVRYRTSRQVRRTARLGVCYSPGKVAESGAPRRGPEQPRQSLQGSSKQLQVGVMGEVELSDVS